MTRLAQGLGRLAAAGGDPRRLGIAGAGRDHLGQRAARAVGRGRSPFWRLLLSGELARNIWVSTRRALAGFADRRLDRLALGLANGLSQFARRHPRRCR